MNVAKLHLRATNIPVLHWCVALLIFAIVGGGLYTGWRMYPVDYVSSSLLSYEQPQSYLAEQSGPAPETITLADSILTDAQLQQIVAQTRYEADDAEDSDIAGVAQDLRSHIDLEQPAAGLLQIHVWGEKKEQLQSVATAVTDLIAYPPHAPAPQAAAIQPEPQAPVAASPVAVPPVNASVSPAHLWEQAKILDENNATLKLQEDRTEHRILELVSAQNSLEGNYGKSASAPAPDIHAAERQQLQARVALATHHLAELRQRYTDNYPDVQTARDDLSTAQRQLASLPPAPQGGDAAVTAGTPAALAGVVKELGRLRLLRGSLAEQMEKNRNQAAELRAQAAVLSRRDGTGRMAAAPAARPVSRREKPVVANTAQPAAKAPDAPAALDTLSGGSFHVFTPPSAPSPIENHARQWLLWTGGVLAVILGAIYLVWADFRYRAVSSLSSVRLSLPPGAKFYGSIAGKPMTGESR